MSKSASELHNDLQAAMEDGVIDCDSIACYESAADLPARLQALISVRPYEIGGFAVAERGERTAWVHYAPQLLEQAPDNVDLAAIFCEDLTADLEGR